MGGVALFIAIGAFARSAKDITIIRINKKRLLLLWQINYRLGAFYF
jgi:hypothetical protein